ncbi:MAG: osmotically inducible protein OsmC [Anaerolineales bacterium]|nr:osmotically inducible protein OsmC [Anaerolineales bacterium]
MDAKISWKGRLSFDGTANTGFQVPLGAKKSVGGDNDGFQPLELLLVGLVGCTAMDVISILEKKRQQITQFEVSAKADRAVEHPRVFTSISIEYKVTGRGVDKAAVERAIELSETKYCPAQAMFAEVVPITHSYTIYEA